MIGRSIEIARFGGDGNKFFGNHRRALCQYGYLPRKNHRQPRRPERHSVLAKSRMNIFKRLLLELQEMSLLSARVVLGLFKKPRYIPETIAQMDSIGVGSMTIIILTGFFTGGVLTLQTYQTLESYGAVSQLGYLVSISLVRELGPVLTALMVTGRVVSAISAELGSMVVSEQIDAMRALGTDPIRKLVAPRLIALVITLPLLTVVGDMLGVAGGWVTATELFGLPTTMFTNSVRDGDRKSVV